MRRNSAEPGSLASRPCSRSLRARRLQDHAPRTRPARSARRPAAAHRSANGGARRKPGASATATIRPIPKRRSATPRRCAASASARRPPPCSSRPRSIIRKNTRVLGAYGRALADAGNFSQALDVLEPRAHARPAGLAHPVGAGRGARPDGPPRGRAAATTRARSNRAGRALGAVQSRPVLRAVEGSGARPSRPCAAPAQQPGAEPRVRQNLALVVGLQGRFAGGRSRSRAPTCRPKKPPPTSPICARCWRSRTARQQGQAEQRALRPGRRAIRSRRAAHAAPRRTAPSAGR